MILGVAMILSDNETCVDFLNNQAIADAVIALLLSRPGFPVTIGVHGDWGAGKSSILEMIENGLTSNFSNYSHILPSPYLDPSYTDKSPEPQTVLTASYSQKDFLCLKFNGWRFQGFEDAKIALLEGIVEELLSKRTLTTKIQDAAKNVFQRIDWLKVAKKTGGVALTAFTGTILPEQLDIIRSSIGAMLKSPSKVFTKENIEKFCQESLELLKPSESSSNISKEVRAFQEAFEALLDVAGIKQLIVLIDDLDRCLPETAIETLEAVRLFLFTKRTAFVVAADESMIEYAVRKHFPDLPENSSSQTYAKNYLEKLIQVPFRIPALGDSETRIYVTLLLVESAIGTQSDEFTALTNLARNKLKKPWISGAFDLETVKKIFGSKYDNIKGTFLISEQISPILASGTKGNPRQVKRFLNSLLLRHSIAEARGFADDIQMPILAKLMLAERFYPELFDKIATKSAGNQHGKCDFLNMLESGPSEKKVSHKNKFTDSSHIPDYDIIKSLQSSEAISEWTKIEPQIGETDLRPYLFLVKDRKDYFGPLSALGHLAHIVDKLMGDKVMVASLSGQISKLTNEEAKILLEQIRVKCSGQDLSSAPAGFEGMKLLVNYFPLLQTDFLDFLGSLPTEKIGPWVIGLPPETENPTVLECYEQLIKKWEKSGSPALKAAIPLLLPQR